MGIGEDIGFIGTTIYHAPHQGYKSVSAQSISTAIIATTGDKSDINERYMLAEIRHAIVKALDQL